MKGSITIINPAGVKSLHHQSVKSLINRLQQAQNSLYKNIIVKTQSYCIFTAMKEVVLRYKEIQETKKIPTPKEIIKMERAI